MSNEDFLPEDRKFPTLALHAGHSPDKWSSKSIATPISLSTNFKLFGPGGEENKYEYSRYDNPNRNILETRLACLEGAKFGLTFSSGMSAINAIVQLLNAGDHVICTDIVYGGTHRLFNQVSSKAGITVSYADLNETKNIDHELKPNTKLIWLENPTNPMVTVIDIRAISRYVKSKNPNVIVVVDNTFLTSYFQKPLTLGADISMYSLSKYMNGHCDVLMGAAVTNNETIYEDLKTIQTAAGAVPSPNDCYLVERSLATLSIRMKQHMENSLKVARFLESHPMVVSVLHPGLKSHPGHELAKQQWSGFSGMLSFYIKGDIEDAKLFVEKLKYFVCANSLGGGHSIIGIPALMSHFYVPSEEREKLGISGNLLRVSVGLESGDDLVEDLDQAFHSVQQAKKKTSK